MEEIEQMVLGGILFLNDKKKTGILRMKFINIRNSTFQPYLCGCRVQFDFLTWISLEDSDLLCVFEPCSWRGVLNTTLCDKVCL
jgi:hypothetical protein